MKNGIFVVFVITLLFSHIADLDAARHKRKDTRPPRIMQNIPVNVPPVETESTKNIKFRKLSDRLAHQRPKTERDWLNHASNWTELVKHAEEYVKSSYGKYVSQTEEYKYSKGEYFKHVLRNILHEQKLLIEIAKTIPNSMKIRFGVILDRYQIVLEHIVDIQKTVDHADLLEMSYFDGYPWRQFSIPAYTKICSLWFFYSFKALHIVTADLSAEQLAGFAKNMILPSIKELRPLCYDPPSISPLPKVVKSTLWRSLHRYEHALEMAQKKLAENAS